MKFQMLLLGAVLLIGVQKRCYGNENIDLANMREAIFKVKVISQAPKFGQPWLQGNQTVGSGTGFLVGPQQIMTNAHVVAGAKFISVQRDGDADELEARILHIAHDADLALLAVDGLKHAGAPLRLGEIPKLRETVATIGYPLGGEQLSVTEGVVSRIGFRRYAHTRWDEHLLVQVDSAINPGNSGGPVVRDGLVVGVAFQSYTKAENTGYIIPPPIVRRFLKDIEDGKYDGHPHLFLETMPGALLNPALRQYHGLTREQGGVKVAFVPDYSILAGLIFPADILLKVQDSDIGHDGKIQYGDERINFRVLPDLMQTDDNVSFRVLRNGAESEINVPLKQVKDYHKKGHIFVERPRFEVFAGIVFSALSLDYLKEWGKAWFQKSPVLLRYLQWHHNKEKRFALAKDIVIISSRLPDPVNSEAEGAEEAVVDRINGIEINRIEDVIKAIKSDNADFIKIELWLHSKPIVLPRKEAIATHEAIITRYGIKPSHWYGSDKS